MQIVTRIITKIATGFVSHGAKVYITSNDEKGCRTTVAELNKLGPGSCDFIYADLIEYREVERLAVELGKKEKSKWTPSCDSPAFHSDFLSYSRAACSYQQRWYRMGRKI